MKIGTLLMTVGLALLKVIWYPMIPWWLVFLPIGVSFVILIGLLFIALVGALISELK